MATFGLSMIHSYAMTHFLFQARIVSPARVGPKISTLLSYGLYPLALTATVIVYLSHSDKLMKELDKKYTPIWLEISAK